MAMHPGLRAVVLTPLLALMAACTAILVPAYDADLVNGLSESNAAALTLFSSLEQGAPQSTFAAHRKDYNAVIGGFEALMIRAKSRDMPAVPQKVVAKLKVSRTICPDPADCINPTPRFLSTILAGMRRLRDQHRKSGAPADQVALIRNGYKISIDQALTVEQAFKR